MNELSELFKLVAQDKKQKKEKFESLVGDLGLDSVFEEVSILKTKSKITNKKGHKALKVFEDLLSSKEMEPNIEEEIEEIFEVVEELQEELEQPKEDLIEKSLGLLVEPSNVKVQQDPITPLDQKFATLDDLHKHYSTFLSRIQQQLSTLGGGGETNLAYMDMPLKYITSSTYTLTPQDYYIGINYAGAVTITLPIPRKNGKTYIVKDELGEASMGVNRYITILPSGSDTIDGRDRAIIAYDYGSLTFVYRNGWRVV
jgi:hypothetical protein